MLQEKGLLDHGFIRLCEKVVFLDVILIWCHHFGQITLQEASLAILLGLLRTSRRLLERNLLIIRSLKLFLHRLLHWVGLKAVHIVGIGFIRLWLLWLLCLKCVFGLGSLDNIEFRCSRVPLHYVLAVAPCKLNLIWLRFLVLQIQVSLSLTWQSLLTVSEIVCCCLLLLLLELLLLKLLHLLLMLLASIECLLLRRVLIIFQISALKIAWIEVIPYGNLIWDRNCGRRKYFFLLLSLRLLLLLL